MSYVIFYAYIINILLKSFLMLLWSQEAILKKKFVLKNSKYVLNSLALDYVIEDYNVVLLWPNLK